MIDKQDTTLNEGYFCLYTTCDIHVCQIMDSVLP